jgi:hypothetical protein
MMNDQRLMVKDTDTIPKLDQASYLFESLGFVEDGLNFDEIRKGLIDVRVASDQERLINIRRSKTTLVDGIPNAGGVFWSNARDVLRELMRLGLVAPTALPSRPEQIEAHKHNTFALTAEGHEYLQLDKRDVREFRTRFLQAMEIAHPYLRELRLKLKDIELFFPRVQTSDLPGDAEHWRSGPPEPLMDLAQAVSKRIATQQGLTIPADRLETQMRPYFLHAWKRRNQDLKDKDNVLSKWAVKTANDIVVRSVLEFHGLRMDFVTFRSAVALLTDLSALWHTRALEGGKGWTIWSTSEGWYADAISRETNPALKSLTGPTWFEPIKVADEIVRDAIIDRFFAHHDRRGGFVLIHELRAEVCHRLKIHGRTFNAVLEKMHSQTLKHEKYAINLDRSGGSELLPSEDPFRIGDRAFYLITLLHRS